MMRTTMTLALILALVPAVAAADTLYQPAPPPVGPGHPLRLGPDHRASQVGDLVYVLFDFSDANSHTNDYSSNKSASLSGGAGTGIFNLPLLRLNNGASGTSTAATTQTATGADSLSATMMATVTNVLPSGVFQITGDQSVWVNGRQQTLHITGYVRPEDIDFTDTVTASHVADVQASFKGDDQKNKGLLSRILGWLF
jgi:flagellar basal body L-ring protein FlgH